MVRSNPNLSFLQSNPEKRQDCVHARSEFRWQTTPPPVKSFVSQHCSKHFLTTGIFSNGTPAPSAEAKTRTTFPLLLSYFWLLEENLSVPFWQVSRKDPNAENSPSFTLNNLQVSREMYTMKKSGIKSYRRRTGEDNYEYIVTNTRNE